MSFGSRLACFRKRRGISQGNFAQRVGLAESHLSRIEKDKQNAPKLETVFRMIEILELTLQEGIDLLLEAGYPAEFFNGSPALAKLDKKKELIESIEAIQGELDLLKRKLKDEAF